MVAILNKVEYDLGEVTCEVLRELRENLLEMMSPEKRVEVLGDGITLHEDPYGWVMTGDERDRIWGGPEGVRDVMREVYDL